MEDNDLIVEFDWKVELEDFLYGLGFIRNESVPLEESWSENRTCSQSLMEGYTKYFKSL
jgi:hypothetical protein